MSILEAFQREPKVFGRDITNMVNMARNLSLHEKIDKNIGKENISRDFQNIKPKTQMNNPAKNELERLAREDKKNPQLVPDYQIENFEYLRKEETKYQICDYIHDQSDINEKMREILIDWLVDVHRKFKFVPETLFLTIYIIDKYLEKNQVKRVNLQLLGVAATFISSKYEVIYPPQLNDFVEITNRTYTKSQILEMEANVIKSLDFNITRPSSLRFFDRYARVLKIPENDKIYWLGRYLLELALVEYKFTQYLQSNLAISSLYLASKIFQKNDFWNQTINFHSKYEEKDIRTCAKDLCLMLQNIHNMKLTAVKRKFSASNYNEISNIQLQKIQ